MEVKPQITNKTRKMETGIIIKINNLPIPINCKFINKKLKIKYIRHMPHHTPLGMAHNNAKKRDKKRRMKRCAHRGRRMEEKR